MGNYWQNRRNVESLQKYLKLPETTRKQLEAASLRKEISQQRDISYSCSKMPDLIKEAKAFAKEWKKNIDDVRLDHSCYQQDYSDSYSSEMHFEINGLETDDQYYRRLMQDYESTRNREEYESKEFERLRQKFNV